MITISAPHELPQATIQLPNPHLQDSRNIESNFTKRKAMDGTDYTYVKTSPSRTLIFDFTMTREKSLELYEFSRHYQGMTMRLYDWKGGIWIVRLINSPIEIKQGRTDGRCTCRLEFQGVQIG